MSPEKREQAIDFVFSFNTPVELDFFTKKQTEQLKDESKKYKDSQDYVSAVIEKEDFDERVDRAVVEGKILSASQMSVVREKLRAIDDMDGVRVDVYESLISRSGQRMIMSERLREILGFFGDAYVLQDEQDEFVSALQADGVPGPEIDRLVSSLVKNGAVVLQRGVFLVLKPLLEDALGRTLRTFNPNAGMAAAPANPAPTSDIPQGEELPFSFIEYLKNNDKEFDRVEHEVMNDQMFLEFFFALKQRYAYYKNLPPERMAGEMICRPKLWVKLSTQTRVWVQNLVERNREAFNQKVKQVASVSHAEKLDELKTTLSK